MHGSNQDRGERQPSSSGSTSSPYMSAEHRKRSMPTHAPYTYQRNHHDEEVLMQQYKVAALAQQMGHTSLGGQGYSPSGFSSANYPQHLPYQHDGFLQQSSYLPQYAQSMTAYNTYEGTGGAYTSNRMLTNSRQQQQQQQPDGYQSMPPHLSHMQGLSHNPTSALPSTPPMQSARSPRQQFGDTLRRGVQSFAYNPSSSSSIESTKDGLPNLSSSTLAAAASLPARPDSAIIRAASLAGETDAIASSGPGRPHLALASTSQAGMGPPQVAPTVPLTLRFPSLPPKPDGDGDNVDVAALRAKYEARDEALVLRIEALGFQPEAAWQALKEVEGRASLSDEEREAAETKERETVAPILGIRLLQKVDSLQRENDELAKIFADKMTAAPARNESEDLTRLIHALDEALTQMTKRAEQAEANVARLEQALAVACLDRSVAIVSNDGSPTTAH